MKKLLWLVSAVFVLVACDGESTGLYDDHGNEVTELRIGLLIDENNPEAGRGAAAFREALSAAIGIPVREIEGVSHLVGIEAMRGGSLDLMVASTFTFATAEQILGVEMLTANFNPDAPPAGPVIITSTENTHIQTLADFEGESFAFVDTASMTGFLLPMYQFVSTLDRNHTQMLTPGYFFSNTILSGAHDASLMAAANGDVAGAAVASVLLESAVANGLVSEDALRVVYTIPPVGDGGYMVRSCLPDDLIEDIRAFLLDFEDEEVLEIMLGSRNARFLPPNQADLDSIRGLMRALEIGEN